MRTKVVKTDVAAVGTQEAYLLQAHGSSIEPALAALMDFVEEFGRLSARRNLEQLKGRRAYSLPELLFGACAMASMWMLIARMLGWFAP